MKARTIVGVAVGLCALAAVSLATSGTALADPSHAKDSGPVTLVCDNGHTYDAVVNSGNSNANTFSPAHDLHSTSVLVPTSFGPFSGTLTDSGGNVVDQTTEPGSTKGNAQAKGGTPVSCTYSFSQTFTVPAGDPNLPPGTYTFAGSGSANGFIPSQ